MSHLWIPALLLALFAGLTPAAPAQVLRRTEIELSVIAALAEGAAPTYQWKGAAHIEARLGMGPGAFVLTLDPGVLVGPTTQVVWGLTEAYVQYRRPAFDLRLGVERIPLETARLMLPLSIEPVDLLGTRTGRLGARLLWYPDETVRVRVAALAEGGAALPLLSVRREFGSFEVEAHALSLAGGRRAYGAGGSGLAGNLVLYGEAWKLTAPEESRYALGLSGSIRDGLWTVEAGYAADLPGLPPRLQLAGQVAYRITEELSITGTARIFADPDASRGQVTLQLSRAAGNVEYSLQAIAQLGPVPAAGFVTAAVTYSF